MATDLRGTELSSPVEFIIGATVGGTANLLCSVTGWFWATSGDDHPSDGASGWVMTVLIAAFVVSLAAVIFVGHRRWMVWGVLIGTALTIPVDLVLLVGLFGPS